MNVLLNAEINGTWLEVIQYWFLVLSPQEKFGGGGGWWWQTKFNVSPGPGLWSLVLGPFGPDLGPDLDLTWDLDLDLSLTIKGVSQFWDRIKLK